LPHKNLYNFQLPLTYVCIKKYKLQKSLNNFLTTVAKPDEGIKHHTIFIILFVHLPLLHWNSSQSDSDRQNVSTNQPIK